jgi:hypothetical protein
MYTDLVRRFLVWGCANNPKFLTHAKIETPEITANETTSRDIELTDAIIRMSSASVDPEAPYSEHGEKEEKESGGRGVDDNALMTSAQENLAAGERTSGEMDPKQSLQSAKHRMSRQDSSDLVGDGQLKKPESAYAHPPYGSGPSTSQETLVATMKPVFVSTWDDVEQDWVGDYECAIRVFSDGRLEAYDLDEQGNEGNDPHISIHVGARNWYKFPTTMFWVISTIGEPEVASQAPVAFEMRSVKECVKFSEAVRAAGTDTSYTHLDQLYEAAIRKPSREEMIHIRGGSLGSSSPSLSQIASLTSRLAQMSFVQDNTLDRPSSAEPGPAHIQPNPHRLDLAISGLSNVDIDDYFSYLDLAADTESSKGKTIEGFAAPKRSMTLPSHPTDFSPDSDNAAAYDSDDSDGDLIRHPRPVSPDLAHKQGKSIPSGARWTKIDRRLVNSQALEEADEMFEEREDFVIVFKVLKRDEVHS